MVLHLGVVLLAHGFHLPLCHHGNRVIVVLNILGVGIRVVTWHTGIAHRFSRYIIDVAVAHPCLMLEVGLHLYPACFQ